MKEQVKAGSWNDALVTMEVLDTEAAKPANKQFQSQLEGPMAFYRGVCEANVDQADKAAADFETFLRLQPNASIDDKVYSKKAVAAFAKAQKNVASAGPSLLRAYQDFRPPAPVKEPVTAAWIDGPVRVADERQREGRVVAADDGSRSAPRSSTSSGWRGTPRTTTRSARRSTSAWRSPTRTSRRRTRAGSAAA